MGAMEEICCAGCSEGLGLFFPKGKYQREVYCDECYGEVESQRDECENEKEELDQKVEDAEKEIAEVSQEAEQAKAELEEAEIREADRDQEEEPIEA